jgi:nitrite transporter NirC
MYNSTLEALKTAGFNKYSVYNQSKFKYFVAAILAGFFIGIGVLVMGLSISIFGNLEIDFVKISNGLIFSLALSLVIMAGAELFTGNVMALSSASFTDAIKGSDAFNVCALSYLGNLVGAFIISVLYLGTGAKGTAIGDAIVGLAVAKGQIPLVPLLFKSILCNILVCLAVLCCTRMKNEAAKLIMIIWCILPFVALGFEHSVANMTVFALGRLLSNEVTFGMIFHNLTIATIGNIIGGLLVSGSYYIIGRE